MDKPVQCKMALNKEQHYVVVATSMYFGEIHKELEELGFSNGEDYYLWHAYELPYDSEYYGIPVGNSSYLTPEWLYFLRYIARVGRFVSINSNVVVRGDHIQSITTSTLRGFLTPDILEKYESDLRYAIVRDKYAHAMVAPRNSISIGNDVWIGANVFINASKVKSIGNGAIIGAGTVVLKDVPPYAVIVGVPGKIKRFRFTPRQIKILEAVRWWDWSNDEIKANMEYILEPELFFEKYAGLAT